MIPRERIQTDYLVVGSGATGMAFADVILSESPSTTLTIVDKRARPGGHWNDAYPFVRLHAPSEYYGVNSERLGRGGYDLSSKAEILAYYEKVLDKFLATGRVRYLPLCKYHGDGHVESQADSTRKFEIDVRRRIVDTTYGDIRIPATNKPRYEVASGAQVVPVNALAEIKEPWQRYVIVGAGKTAMDAVLFLTNHGVEPDRIHWIIPNDAWFFNRASVQPGVFMRTFLDYFRCIAESSTVDKVFLRLERMGKMYRLDHNMMPKRWRCAILEQQEIDKLRKIKNIVRLGYVTRIDEDVITLQNGSIPIEGGTLHVNCSANGLYKGTPKPIFEEKRITPQEITFCLPTFSASAIAYLESLDLTDDQRNEVFKPLWHPSHKQDFVTLLYRALQNMVNANRYMGWWMRRSRLNAFHYDPLPGFLLGNWKLQRMKPNVADSVARMVGAESA